MFRLFESWLKKYYENNAQKLVDFLVIWIQCVYLYQVLLSSRQLFASCWYRLRVVLIPDEVYSCLVTVLLYCVVLFSLSLLWEMVQLFDQDLRHCLQTRWSRRFALWHSFAISDRFGLIPYLLYYTRSPLWSVWFNPCFALLHSLAFRMPNSWYD